jgi:tetratricopeptide (TPR) repeat protein
VSRQQPAALVLAALLIGAGMPQVPAAAATSLTAPDRLAGIYDLILDARFDRAETKARAACEPAPAVACHLLEVTSLWWRMQLDEESTARDAEFAEAVDAVIAEAEAWTEQEPDRAEAWFYLGGAYGARVQWRVLRGERLAAARDGKRIKQALEQAIELDPTLHDARFGIGLYKYYADLAPAAAKILRFLLLLPGGDRVEGLEAMTTARDRGALLRGEADYQLHWIYFWYEDEPRRGLALLEGLRARYPHNPLFVQRIAEVQLEYFHDPAASLATWLEMLREAEAGRLAEAALAATRARFGAAARLDALAQTDRAIDLLTAVVRDEPAAPHGALARAHYLLGTYLDRMGRRAEAVAAYRAAIAAAPEEDEHDTASRARFRLRQATDARSGEAYRLALEGWRAFERGSLAEAARLLDRSLALRPDEGVALYRRARVYRAQGELDRSLALLTRAIEARPSLPPVFLALAYVERAQTLEAQRDRTGAIEAYRRASRVFGADARTLARARDAIARLQPPAQSSGPRRR